MNRKIYKLPFTSDGPVRWMCPTCNNSVLKIKKGTFQSVETKLSKEAHGHDAWDPEWIEYVFSCILVCANPACGDVVACSGSGSVDFEVEYDDRGYPHQAFADYYVPKQFSPHLKMFLCPSGTPENVSKEIAISFSLFFSDASSSANHIRIALEELLTHLKIKRSELKGKRRTFLTLHRRIELLPAKYKHLQDLFLAIKWLGNAGSHGEKKVSMDDVLDAYEIMVEILDELFAKKAKAVKRLAKKINKSKGPKRKIKKSI